MYDHDVVLVLIYEEPGVTDKTGWPFKSEKIFTWQDLFGGDGAEFSCEIGNATVDVICQDNILLINTSEAVDAHLFDSLPVDKLVVITKGGCSLSSQKETLGNIDIDIKAGAIVLDSNIDNARSVKLTTEINANGVVHVRKPIATNTLSIKTNAASLWSQVQADKAILNGDLLKIEASGKLLIGAGSESNQELNINSIINAGEISFINSIINGCRFIKLIPGSLTTFIQTKFFAEQLEMLKDAKMFGNNSSVTLSNDGDIDGVVKINNFVMHAPQLLVNKNSTIESDGHLKLSGNNLSVYGQVSAKNTDIDVTETISAFNLANISGLESLSIKSLVTSLAAGVNLYGSTTAISCAAYINFGSAVRAYNFTLDCLLPLDFGITVPCLPHSRADFLNINKAMTVGLMLVSNVYKPAALLANAGMSTFTIAQNLVKLFNSYSGKEAKAWQDQTWRDSLEQLLLLKRTLSTTVSLAQTAAPEQTQKVVNTISEACKPPINNTAVKTIVDSIASVNIAKAITDNVKHSLGDVIDTAENIATSINDASPVSLAEPISLIAPTINVQSVVDVNAGLNMSYSVNKQNLFSFNAGIVTGVNVRNQTVFDQYNAGVYEANNLNLASSNHYNAGVEHAANKLALNANNAHITKSAELRSDNETQVVINEEFKTEGNTSLANGTLQAKNLQQNGKFHTKNMSLDVDQLAHNGDWSYGGDLSIKSKHFESSLNSTFDGEDGSSHGLDTESANALGSENHRNTKQIIKKMPVTEVNEFANGVGKHKNKNVRESIEVESDTTENLILNNHSRPAEVAVGIKIAGSITNNAPFNGNSLHLTSASSSINLNADINTKSHVVLTAAKKINKPSTTIRSSHGNAILNADEDIDNSNGGLIDAPNGIVSVKGTAVDNNCSNSGVASSITGKAVFVEATTGDIKNQGSLIKATEFLSAIAAGDIINTAKELNKHHGENPYVAYICGRIVGGTGNNETNGVGAYLHAAQKIICTASEIGATGGKAIIQGDLGVEMETKSNAYKSYDYRIDHGKTHKTYLKGEATEYGQVNIFGEEIIIVSSNAGVMMHGVLSESENGVKIYAKHDIVLESHVSKEKNSTVNVHFKIFKSSKETIVEVEKINVVYTNTGQIHAKSEEGSVLGTGNQFLGGEDAKLLVEANKNIKLVLRNLNHQIIEKSKRLDINIAGQTLTNHEKIRLMERVLGADPLLSSIDQATKSTNAIEGAANTNNLISDATQLLEQVRNDGVTEAIKNRTSTGVRITDNKTITNLQAAGGGGNNNLKEAKFVALGDVILGVGMDNIKDMDVAAKKLVMTNNVLRNFTKSKQTSVSASVNFAGEQTYGAGLNKNTSQSVTQTQGLANIGNLHLNVDELHISGVKVYVDNIDGRADRVITEDKLNQFSSKSEGYYADSNGSANVSKSKASSATLGAVGSLRAKNGTDDLTVNEYENYGSSPTVFNSNVKQTQTDLREYEKCSGYSAGFNLKQFANADSSGVNISAGVQHKNSKASMGANGRHVHKDQKTDAKVRFKVPKEAFAKNTEAKEPEAKNPAPMIFSSSANNAENSSDPKSVNAPEYLSASAKPYESTERVQLERVINEPWKFEHQKPKTKLNKMPNKAKSEVEKKKPEQNVHVPKPEVKKRFAIDPDDQEVDFYDKPVQKDPQAVKQIFDHIVAAKDAVIDGYFGRGIRSYERISKEHDIKPDVTNMIYAGPLLARAALFVVPETPGELVFDVAMLVGAEPVAASSMWLYHCAKGGGIIKKTQPALVKFSQSSVNDWGTISDSMKKSGWKWSKKPVDIVKMSDGTLITLDNTRLLAAHDAGIELRAIIRNHDEILKPKVAKRFHTPLDGTPTTWEDAIKFRINKQNKAYKSKHANGSHVVGLGKKYE